MSLTKKDPSLRVAANDPHLVSLGGGRLSTAVTIHYIPIGDTTIGSSANCSIPLNGSGVLATHCTIYRSEQNEVTIVPECEARILIDGTKITSEFKLTQGTMITIGNSNYLRFNNPAEAQLIRSAMGSNERVSMAQIDFTLEHTEHHHHHHQPHDDDASENDGGNKMRNHNQSVGGGTTASLVDTDEYYKQYLSSQRSSGGGEHFHEITNKIYDYTPKATPSPPIDINNLQCPKVFTADLVTVNMPAKDVLGQKYANFAKNLAENHRNDKNVSNVATLRNNQVKNVQSSTTSHATPSNITSSNYMNIPSNAHFIQNNNNSNSNAASNTATNTKSEYLVKVNNTSAAAAAVAATSLQSAPSTSASSSPSFSGVVPRATHHAHNHSNIAAAYDRYPKPGTYGGLQIFPMNGLNTEMNSGSPQQQQQQQSQHSIATNLCNADNDCLEEMLKKCTEYADRQQQSQMHPSVMNNSGGINTACSSTSSSPIVQNRIKTNGSLPREKKSPYYYEHITAASMTTHAAAGENTAKGSKHLLLGGNISSGYENVRITESNHVEINGQTIETASATKSGYENVALIGKYVPQSPRTKIRTTCMSPKKEYNSFSNLFGSATTSDSMKPKPPAVPAKPASKQNEYEQLIRTFEEKLKLEMQAIEDNSLDRSYQTVNSSNNGSSLLASSSSVQSTPVKRTNKNINNLMLNMTTQLHSLQNSPKLDKKPVPAPRHFLNMTSHGDPNSKQIATSSEVIKRLATIKMLRNSQPDLVELKRTRQELIANIQALKQEISELKSQEDEALREFNLEKVLVSAELNSVRDAVIALNSELQMLQQKIHRLEAQRNSTRVMEENQQAKLKQSIEMKQDQVAKLKVMLKHKSDNECLKQELGNVTDSLENDRKTFEDLEFQYLEEESEWHAYREELHAEEKALVIKIEEKQLELQHLQKQELTTQTTATADVRILKNNVITLLSEFNACQQRLRTIENSICNITGSSQCYSSDDDDDAEEISGSNSLPLMPARKTSVGVMSQSLFGSAEMLYPKAESCDLMSKSVNENMFFNNNIELPRVQGAAAPMTSTPKRPQLQTINIADDVDGVDDQLHGSQNNAKDEAVRSDRVKFNLSLGNDDFEVNPLEKRVPSQDDIDRISKVTIDAPISTRGATSKIFDSIKEIERNRKLLLAQQGHHVIEHERQKMHDLKKKSHDEAHAQYIAQLSSDTDTNSHKSEQKEFLNELQLQQLNSNAQRPNGKVKNPVPPAIPPKPQKKKNDASATSTSSPPVPPPSTLVEHDKQRLSQPEFDTLLEPSSATRNPRPLSDANSELNCEHFHTPDHNTTKSTAELTAATSIPSIISATQQQQQQLQQQQQQPQSPSHQQRSIQQQDDYIKRSSVNSISSSSCGGGGGSGSLNGGNASSTSTGERKRALAKHQRPLTRYLPIFSPDLNLRQHIESAGHQIALCPYVFIDAYSCRGYLHKLGATFHGWARRWFVFDRQRSAFIYYSDKSERKPRGGAYFSTIDEVYLDHLNASKSGRPHCTFIVKTKKRSYHLQAASDAAARIWIDSIITGAQGHLDY